MKVIRVNQQLLLPSSIRWVVMLILGAMVIKVALQAMAFEAPRLQAVAIVVGFAAVVLFLVFTTRWVLEVNVQHKTWKHALRIIGFHLGISKPFNAIERVFINKLRMKQNAMPVAPGLPSLLPSYSEYLYKAFLKFDDGEKLELLTDTDKAKLVRTLNRYNDVLQTQIWDTTGE